MDSDKQPPTSPFSAEQLTMLKQPLNPRLVKTRKSGGGLVPYLKGHTVIDTANRIIGYGRWGFELISVELNNVTAPTGEIIGYYHTARLKLIVAGCIPITEEGICAVEVEGSNFHKQMAAIDTSRKGSITDALKRALRCYGLQFGNALEKNNQPTTHAASNSNHSSSSAPTATAKTGARTESGNRYETRRPSSGASAAASSGGGNSGSRPSSATSVPGAGREVTTTATPLTHQEQTATKNIATAAPLANNTSDNQSSAPPQATEQQIHAIRKLANQQGLTEPQLNGEIFAVCKKVKLDQLTKSDAGQMITHLQTLKPASPTTTSTKN